MRVSDQTLNRLAVLKEIRRRGPVSRTELTGIRGLSAATITQLTGDFIKRGIVVEEREAARRPGRPRTHLSIAADSGIVIGATLEAEGVLTTAFVDMLGNRLFSHDVAFPAASSLIDVADFVAKGLAAAIATSPFTIDQIGHVGVALPAIVDTGKGLLWFMATIPPSPIPFAQIISERLGLPVTIENDVSCMARAEHWSGEAQGHDDFTLIHVSYLIGSAEFVDGLPKVTGNGLNPEFGHVKSSRGRTAAACLCGADGCLATVASMYGLVARSASIEFDAIPTAEDVSAGFDIFVDRVRNGDAVCAGLLRDATLCLGEALANYINATSPKFILIIVHDARMLNYMKARLLRVVERAVVPRALDVTQIEVSVERSDWRWTGSAALALEQAYLSEKTARRRKSSAPIR